MPRHAWDFVGRVLALLALACCPQARAQEQPAEVMLFGTFHFRNAHNHLVDVDPVATTPAHLAYLSTLAQRLCAFRPTRVLVESDPRDDDVLQRQFSAYRHGDSPLADDETEQLGFRVAQACGVDQVQGFDENQVHWNGERLMAYLERSEPDLKQHLESRFRQIEAAQREAHRSASLGELLRLSNDPEQDRDNIDLYLLPIQAGAGHGFEGADAAALWWHRNLRMYANLQRLARPGERLLVIAGQGHTAMLRRFLAIDRRLVARDVRPFL